MFHLSDFNYKVHLVSDTYNLCSYNIHIGNFDFFKSFLNILLLLAKNIKTTGKHIVSWEKFQFMLSLN